MFAYNIKEIEREYEHKRNEANKAFNLQKDAIYKDNPNLAQIDQEIKKIGIKSAKLALLPNSDEKVNTLKNLEEQLFSLKKEKEKILDKLQFKSEPIYSCSKCKDTGYVTTPSGSHMCNCMKQKLINEVYNSSNMYNLQNETFQKLDYTLLSDMPNKDVYKSDLSPRDNMKKIVNISKEFISNFKDYNQKSLLFTGTTGVGKTFLSSCIANEIINQGYTVLYQTAPILLSSIFDYKYNSKYNDSNKLYDNFLKVNLLIIDDLGTENLTPAKFAELFTILNSRLLTPNTKTIISTNLSLEELNKNYDSRLLSRFIGNYTICRFFGDDIRLKK